MSDTTLIHGFHAVVSKLRHAPDDIKEIYLASERSDPRMRDVLAQAELLKVKVMQVPTTRLDGMAPAARHQGVVAKVSALRRHVSLDDIIDTFPDQGMVLVLDGVKDPHNLGACLRVADAVGALAVIAPKDRACGLNATAAKVACGAAETVPYVVVTNLARALREMQEAGIWVVGTAGEAEHNLYQAQWPARTAWVLGAEGEGLRRLTRETCDLLVGIPMMGQVESLNVSVASGVCLFEARRRLSSLDPSQ